MTPLEPDTHGSEPNGTFDVRYIAFLQTLTHLRPLLHRYCARMTGSVLDGEDVMQEALFEAYRKLDQLDDPGALRPWLFRIAHHRCLDFIRKRSVRAEAEAQLLAGDAAAPLEPSSVGVGRAVERLVLHLPPKERACVLLKDVLDYSLEEIAELVDSTVGGVKAALHRGRSKLAALPTPTATSAPPERSHVLALYVERFNQRDWEGLRRLTRDDARLSVADRYRGALAESPYFSTYAAWPQPWRLALGHVEGAPVVVVHLEGERGFEPTGVVHIELAGQQIVAIDDYLMCPWMLDHAEARATGDVA